jgi:hypothetical protein
VLLLPLDDSHSTSFYHLLRSLPCCCRYLVLWWYSNWDWRSLVLLYAKLKMVVWVTLQRLWTIIESCGMAALGNSCSTGFEQTHSNKLQEGANPRGRGGASP